MRRNAVINLGFILANLAMLVLLQQPGFLSAMEDVGAVSMPGLPSVDNTPAPPGLVEVVVPLVPRPIREDAPGEAPESSEDQAEPVPEAGSAAEQDTSAVAEGEGGDSVQPDRELAKVFRQLPTQEKVVALTFDDGPKETVRELLAILREKDVPATFFLLGNKVKSRPDLVRAILDSGCEIANHSWSHPHLTDLTEKKVFTQIDNCTAAFASMEAEYQSFMRPPYGDWDEKVLAACASRGYSVLLWNVDTRDWEYNSPKIVLKRALAGLKPGCIVLFHDGPKVTLKVLPDFIDEAKARGYKFVLISDYIE